VVEEVELELFTSVVELFRAQVVVDQVVEVVQEPLDLVDLVVEVVVHQHQEQVPVVVQEL
jgi:hypothetical protein